MSDLIPKEGKGLEVVANHLIDKISAGIGWVFNRDTPKRIAVKDYIHEIEESNLPPLYKAVLISRARKDIKEYAIQLNIVNNAISYLQANARPEELEDDWVSHFFDKARLVSAEDFQAIWARLLAEECNNPGSVPKSLLFILEKMDRKEAEEFMSLCSITITAFDESAPLVLSTESKTLNDFGLSFDSLIQLESIGLLKLSGGHFYGFTLIRDEYDSDKQSVRYFGNRKELPKSMDHFPVGHVLFTKDGYALWKVVSATEIEGFWDKTVVPLIERNITNHKNESKAKQNY